MFVTNKPKPNERRILNKLYNMYLKLKLTLYTMARNSFVICIPKSVQYIKISRKYPMK